MEIVEVVCIAAFMVLGPIPFVILGCKAMDYIEEHYR
jgi:hypothetical protein